MVALDRIARAPRNGRGLRARSALGAALLLVVGACTSATPSSAPASVPPVAPSPTATASSPPTEAPTPTATDAPTATPTEAPTPTPAPTATPTPAPEAWQQHASKRFQYAIEYPPGWFVTPGDATHADQFDGLAYPYVYVSRDAVRGSVSIRLTVADMIRTTKAKYAAKVTANKPIRLAGGYAGRIVTFEGKDGDIPVTIQKIFVAKGREGYFLYLFADDGTRSSGLETFERMYRSWRPR